MDVHLVRLGHALGCEVRFALMQVVGEEGLTLSEAAQLVGVSRSTAHHHYAELLKVGLVVKKGRRRGCRYCWPSQRLFVGFREETRAT